MLHHVLHHHSRGQNHGSRTDALHERAGHRFVAITQSLPCGFILNQGSDKLRCCQVEERVLFTPELSKELRKRIDDGSHLVTASLGGNDYLIPCSYRTLGTP